MKRSILEILAAVVIGAIIGAGLMGIAIMRDDVTPPGVMPGTVVTVSCEEDQPCWDCSHEMGNEICGVR